MQIWVAVNEADVGRVKVGTPAIFTCDAFPGREFKGAVGKVRLNASMTQNVVTYTVEVDTENPDQVLLPYLTANVRFILANASNVLLVPNAALRWTPSSGGQVADSLEGNGKPELGTIWLTNSGSLKPVQVNVGATDGVKTVVESKELREGQLVVTGETASSSQAESKSPFLPKTIKR